MIRIERDVLKLQKSKCHIVSDIQIFPHPTFMGCWVKERLPAFPGQTGNPTKMGFAAHYNVIGTHNHRAL